MMNASCPRARPPRVLVFVVGGVTVLADVAAAAAAAGRSHGGAVVS